MFEMLLLLETFLVIRKYLFVGCIYYLYLSDSFIQNMTCYTTETEIHSLYFFFCKPTHLIICSFQTYHIIFLMLKMENISLYNTRIVFFCLFKLSLFIYRIIYWFIWCLCVCVCVFVCLFLSFFFTMYVCGVQMSIFLKWIESIGFLFFLLLLNLIILICSFTFWLADLLRYYYYYWPNSFGDHNHHHHHYTHDTHTTKTLILCWYIGGTQKKEDIFVSLFFTDHHHHHHEINPFCLYGFQCFSVIEQKTVDNIINRKQRMAKERKNFSLTNDKLLLSFFVVWWIPYWHSKIQRQRKKNVSGIH